MAAGLSRAPSQENVSTTLSSGITDVAGTMTVADASNIQSPCYLVIDRVDSSGTLKSTSLWEYVKVTAKAGNDLTITRAQGGSTGQAHSSGAVVEAVVTAAIFEEYYAALNPEHTLAGEHVIAGTMTIAGMNLASVATISNAGIGDARVVRSLNASGASLSGFPLAPVFTFIGTLSGPTTFSQTPLILPRSGVWQSAVYITRTVASGVSAIVDVKVNSSSIFDAVGRPMILAGGTFASTASIKTKNFFKGDVLTWDYAGTGGTITDFNIQLISE